MKIRIKDNSVRLRLTKTEVETFSETGVFESETQLLGGKFYYALKASNQVSNLEAKIEGTTITVFMPSAFQEEWNDSPKVGYENHMALNENESLRILVEKDFACLDETIEDQSDNYPNPSLKC